jgi:hypothetical protein
VCPNQLGPSEEKLKKELLSISRHLCLKNTFRFQLELTSYISVMNTSDQLKYFLNSMHQHNVSK